jgi:hypothetical protein
MIMSKFLSVAPITIAVLDGAVGDLPRNGSGEAKRVPRVHRKP